MNRTDKWTNWLLGLIPVSPNGHVTINYVPNEYDVTVTVKEDDEIVFCNHAGHQSQTMIFTTPYWNGENYEMSGTESKTVEVCDKCGMWSEDEENWNE